MKVKILVAPSSHELEVQLQELLDTVSALKHFDMLVLPSGLGCVVVYEARNPRSSVQRTKTNRKTS